MARLLAGTAVVYSAESYECDEELAYFLPQTFRCEGGMVRVFQPKVKLTIEADSTRHRFFPPSFIKTRGVAAVEGIIVRGIARSAWSRPNDIVTSIDDVLSRAREMRLKELKTAADSGAKQQELIAIFETENVALEQKLRDHRQQIQGLEVEVEQLQGERGELDSKVARLEFEKMQMKQSVIESDLARAQFSQKIRTIQNLTHLPESLGEVIEMIEALFPERIVFTEKAKKSAAGYQIETGISWRCLFSMANCLHELYSAENLTLREIAKEFQLKTTFELTFFESEATRSIKKLAAQRSDVFEGKPIDISSHLKHRTSKPNLLRVHYCWVKERKLIVVGHCGDHLDTMRTN